MRSLIISPILLIYSDSGLKRIKRFFTIRTVNEWKRISADWLLNACVRKSVLIGWDLYA